MNETKVIIGLDLGTTNAKAKAYTTAGLLVSEACTTYPTYHPNTGWSEQNPQDWIDALKNSLQIITKQLNKQGLQPEGLGISAHAPGLVLTDELGLPLSETFPIWQDTRALLQSKELLENLGVDWVGLGSPSASFAAKLLWFVQNRRDLASKAFYALGVKGFIIHWLTGNFVTDPSSEPGNETTWAEMCNYCGWSLKRLPKLLAATDVAGFIRNELADEVGLPRELPVIMGINDGGSATLANGVTANGECVIQLATNGVVYMATSTSIQPRIRYDHSIFCWKYLENLWISGGQTKCGADNLRWIAKLITGDGSSKNIDNLLCEAGTVPPGSRGIIFLPYLMGRGTPFDKRLPSGVFSGLSLCTERGDICRALLEGVAFAIREVFECLIYLKKIPTKVYITGGGARSELWRQVVANVLNKNIIYSDADSCLGGAILATVGLGIHSNLQDAVNLMIRPKSIIQPEIETVHLYQELFNRYKILGSSLPEAELDNFT